MTFEINRVVPSPLLFSQPGLSVGFMTRQGGVSTGDLASLNFRSQGDQESCLAENRRRVELFFDVPPGHVLYPHQVHGNTVLTVHKPYSMMSDRPMADALVTAVPNLAIGVITADCVPVLFYDPQNRVVGASHAGWRGAIGGILHNTVLAMTDVGANVKTIIAAIGPCIHQSSYQVGGEMRDLFCEQSPGSDRFFIIDRAAPNHFLFDLPGFVHHALTAIGITAIHSSPYDTYAMPSVFHSCRKAAHLGIGTFGCQFSGLALK